MPIETFLQEKIHGWQADLARRLIALLHRIDPAIVTVLKWGHPVFELGGPFAYLKPAKAHVTIGFWQGIALDDPTGLLNPGERMRHFKLTATDTLDEAVVTALMKQAVQHNRAHGDPTKRRS